MRPGRRCGSKRAVLLVLSAAVIGMSGCAPLDRAELTRQTASVEAVASEGAILAQQVAADRTTDNFVRVHADELASQADHVEEKLRETQEEGEVPRDLLPLLNRTVGLAGRASDALDALRLTPGDSGRAAGLEESLRRTASRAHRLVEGT